jgi:hypothetical protein
MLREADNKLKACWTERFRMLSPEARDALKDALMALRTDALKRADYQWSKHKAPLACYWKVVGVYAGHIARALNNNGGVHD